MYKILLTAKARRENKHISKLYQVAVKEIIEEIKIDPLIGKPLTRELSGRFSYKVGVFRIIYIIKKEDKNVIIISAGHRSIVYN